MIVNSKNPEFGYELIAILPFAYWAFKNGQLEKTISGNDTDCLYYFSPKHEINKAPRDFANTPWNEFDNIKIHTPRLNKSRFLPPPLKEQYKNNRFKFDKELIIICNRHNTEWKTKPINFFDIPTLRKMFELLKEYQVIYINIEGRKELYDNAPPEPLGDFDILKEYENVINIHDLHNDNEDLSFNELQLMLFANCSKFITMNGGHAILSAYFGGENILMSKPGKPQAQELKDTVNSFYGWYHEFGGQRVLHVQNEEKLINKINSLWVKKEPEINVLVRTSGRPNYFDACIKSLLNQNYENLNIFVSIDNEYDTYPLKYPVYRHRVFKEIVENEIINKIEYGKILPYNLYFNELHKRVNNGLIIYLDDDDKHNDFSLQKIASGYKKGNDLIFWRVKIGSQIIPNDNNWKKEPEVFQLSGIGFAFDAKYKKHANWEGYKRGDFRVGKKLFGIIKKRAYINEILAEAQDGSHWGVRVDAPGKNSNQKIMERLIKIKFVKNLFPYKAGYSYEEPEARANQFIRKGFATAVELIEISKPEKKSNTVRFEIEDNKPKVKRTPVVEAKDIEEKDVINAAIDQIKEIPKKRGRKPKK